MNRCDQQRPCKNSRCCAVVPEPDYNCGIALKSFDVRPFLPVAVWTLVAAGLWSMSTSVQAAGCTVHDQTYAECFLGGDGQQGSGSSGGLGSNPGDNNGGNSRSNGQGVNGGQGHFNPPLTLGGTSVAGGNGGGGSYSGAGGGGGDIASHGLGGGGGGSLQSNDVGGGGGGLGVLLHVDTDYGSDTLVRGGDGASGSHVSSGGGAGGGGAAIWLRNGTLSNAGTIIGGDGGAGGNGSYSTGGGGGGGAGLLMDSGVAIINQGMIRGGDGGMSVAPAGSISSRDDAGQGGSAVYGGNFTLSNSGLIEGGAGNRHTGGGSSGGAGIISTGGSTIINSGTIRGGQHGSASTRNNAVVLSGGGNRLILQHGYVIDGNVVSSNTDEGDVLVLSGEAAAHFNTSQLGSQYRGFTQLEKNGTGQWTLNGTDGTASDWTISQGTLVGDANSLRGDLFVGIDDPDTDALVEFNQVADGIYNGTITGYGALRKSGTGRLVLASDSSVLGGTTSVEAGSLIVGNANTSSAVLGSDVNVLGGATFGGHGRVDGDVSVQGGATLAPGPSSGYSPGTLSVSGDLTAEQGSVLAFELAVPSSDAYVQPGLGSHVRIDGDLHLKGAHLHVHDVGGMGAGLYSLFSYGGDLYESNGGLALDEGPDRTVWLQRLSDDKRINVIDTTGITLHVWNANEQASSERMGGGDGVWSRTARHWTDASGEVPNLPMDPQPGFALFGGDAGIVTVDSVDGGVQASGLQFASDGYVLRGDALELVPGDPSVTDHAVIRVGDGSLASSDMTAVVETVLTGHAGFRKTDSGTLVLAAENTYTGGTRIEMGRVDAVTDTALGLGSVHLHDGATLGLVTQDMTLNNEFELVSGQAHLDVTDTQASLRGGIMGAGSLVKTGDGTLDLSGVNTFTGGTVVLGGVLRAMDSQAFVANTAYEVHDGTLDLNGHDLSVSELTGSGGAIDLGGARLTVAQSGLWSSQYAGHIHGAGDLVLEQGQLILSGDHTYTGDTLVRQGTLTLGTSQANADASLRSHVRVSPNARLEGVGAVGGLTVSGVVSPGHSIGTLKVNGDYRTLTGSVYQVDVDAQGRHDVIQVSGEAILDGGVVQVVAAPGAYEQYSLYDILVAQNGVSGTYDSVTSNFAFLDPALLYEPNRVIMALARNDIDFTSVAHTFNQRAAAKGVSSLYGSGMYQHVVPLSAPQARRAFEAVSGEYYASRQSRLLEHARHFERSVSRRLSMPCTHSVRRADHLEGCANGLWVQPHGDWGRVDGNKGAADLNYKTAGIQMGADVKVGHHASVGMTAAYAHTDDWVNEGRDSQGKDEAYQIGVYAGWRSGALNVKTGLAHTWHDLSADRHVAFAGHGERVSADYRARTTRLFAETGYQFDFDSTQLTPFVRGSWSHLNVDGFEESGADAVLQTKRVREDRFSTLLGVRVSHVKDVDVERSMTLYGHVGWRHTLGGLAPETTHSLVGGSAFTVRGAPLARNAMELELGANFELSHEGALGLSYAGQFGQGYSHRLQMHASWHF